MTYLIAGASSDVGCAYIEYLNEKQTSGPEKPLVLAHYHSSAEKLKQLKTDRLEVIPVQADLSTPDGTAALCGELAEKGYEISHFLYLPAVRLEYCKIKKLQETDMERLRRDMELQAYSFLELCRQILPGMKKRGSGRVAVMLSRVATDELPPAFMAPYVVSKYALMGAMKAVAAEYGGNGVTVGGIAPDMMDTAFLSELDERFLEIAAAKSSIGRLLRPEEIAPFIDKIMESDGAESGKILTVTGETIGKK